MDEKLFWKKKNQGHGGYLGSKAILLLKTTFE